MEGKERATRPPTIVGYPGQMMLPGGETGLVQEGDSTPDWSPDTVLWRSLPNSVVDNRSSRSSSGIPTSLTDSTIEEDPVGTAKSLMASSLYSTASSSLRLNPQIVNTRVEMVYSLLSSLASEDRDDVSETLENMTTSKESCLAMRQSGCIPLLVQLLHGTIDDQGNPKGRLRSRESRMRAGRALHNIVHALPDDKRSRREARVVKLLEQVREFCDILEEGNYDSQDEKIEELDHPNSAVAALMKLSFDEEHRHAICQLGGLQAIAELLHCDFAAHGHNKEACLLIRRYSGMTLTNLTFGDGNNKAALCSMRSFMTSLVAQLDSKFEDLKQVTASVLRNLSWRADSRSRVSLRESGSVISLTKCMMSMEKEATLKSVLSALWNLSAHCTENKIQICSVDGSLGFLVSTLTYRSHSKNLSIVENGGGILRNISSYVATQEQYRKILRQHSCLEILLQQLKSPSLTVVSNACGTLWNLSARCTQDQKRLWDLGAVGMLRNLVNSKHKMISMGSAAALKNLLTAQHLSEAVECGGLDLRFSSLVSDDSSLKSSESSSLRSCDTPPVLLARKAKNLKHQFITGEAAKNLSELCDNIEASPKTSPISEKKSLFFPTLPGRMYYSVGEHVPRSASRDSVRSTYSEPGYIRPRPHSLGQLRHSSIERYVHIDWSTASAFLASSEGTRAASARRRPSSSSSVRPTSTYASFISTSIFEDKEESSPSSSKHGTPKREPRKPATKESAVREAVNKPKSHDNLIVAERALASPMSGSMTDSQSSGSCGLKRSRIPQVKRPTESPPPPPIFKKKSNDFVELNESMDTRSTPPIERSPAASSAETPSSESELNVVHTERPPVPARSIKAAPTPPPTSPNPLSRKGSGNNNNDSDKTSSSLSDKSPPTSPRKSLTNKHLKAVDIEDDSSIASDLCGVQPPSFFNDLAGSMASSCGSIELVGERSPKKKLSLQARQCWNADEWSPKSCENLDNVMPPSGLNSIECLSLGSSMNSEMLLNANPPSFLEDDVSFDDRTRDIADETTRDIVNHNEAPIFPRVNTATYTQQQQQNGGNNLLNKPQHNCVAQLLDDPTEIGSDAFLSDVEGEEDLPYDSSTEYYTCQQSTDTLRASNFMSCNSGHTRDATVGSSDNLTSLDNTLTFDVPNRANRNGSCNDLTYDATLVYEPDDECSVVSSVDDATYDISSPQPQTPTKGARIVKPVIIDGVAVFPGCPPANKAAPVVIVTGKNARNSPKKIPSVPIRQTRASALRASRAQTPTESERGSRSTSSSPARSPTVNARLSSPANRRPLSRTAASSPTPRTPIGGKAPQVSSPLASRSSSLNNRVTSIDNMRPPSAPRTQNENLPPKPALVKQGTFTKDSGELSMKPTPPSRTVVPNVQTQNKVISQQPSAARASMHKSNSMSHNMTRSTHPTLNRTQSDATQMSKSVVQTATQRVPLAMRTTAASRARAAAIAHAKAQPSQARVVLTRRATSSGERSTNAMNNLNNNRNSLQMDESSALIRSGTYEKINEVGLSAFQDKNHNNNDKNSTMTPVRPSEFWSSKPTTAAPSKGGFLKRSVGGRKVGDSSPVAAPRTIPGLKSPTEVSKLVGCSPLAASPAAVVAPFSYRPRSTPTTPNGSKIPMMRSTEEQRKNSTADEEGYIVATARLVTTV